ITNQPYTSHAFSAAGDYVVVLRAFNQDYPSGVVGSLTVHVTGQPLYVSLSSTNALAPYGSWATAASNIQQAVDIALPGATIIVSNGVYARGSHTMGGVLHTRVVVAKPIIVRSLSGPQFTFIQGVQVPGTTNGDLAVRCIYLTNGAQLV